MDFAKLPALPRWLFLMCSALLALPLGAAQRTEHSSPLYTIDSWDNDDGLPQTSVISMVQTRDGYLWLGTINGLVRFDGLRFTIFNDDNTPGLGSSPIVSLFEDRRGDLWIGSQASGALRARDGRIHSTGIGGGGLETRMLSICEDAHGSVWMTFKNGQLWRHASDGSTNLFLTPPERSAGYKWVMSDRAGQPWFATDASTFTLGTNSDLAGGRLVAELPRVSSSVDMLLAGQSGGYWRFGDGRIERWETNGAGRIFASYAWRAPVTSAAEDRDGNLLVGTLGEGVFQFTPDGRATALESNRVLYVLSLLVDRENTVWVGTDGNGLLRLKPRLFHVVEPSRGLTVRSVAEDAAGGVWMGFNAFDFSAPSVGYFKDGEYRAYGRENGLMNPSVLSVLADRAGRVWAGSGGGLFGLQGRRFATIQGAELLQAPVPAIHAARDGSVLFGTGTGLIRLRNDFMELISTRDGLTSDDISAVVEDAQGALWIGTRASGLNRLHNGKVTVFRKGDGLPSDEISSLYIDVEDALWVGTRGGGLGCHRQGRWLRFTTRDGLVSNHIGCVIEDGTGHLWIGSNTGLMRVPRRALVARGDGGSVLLNVRSFGRADGLPTRECTLGSQPGAARGKDGRLWFPTVKGLVVVDPARILPNTNPPPVAIESITVDGEEPRLEAIRSHAVSSLTLSPKREHLEITFTSLNLSSPERARFRYRLVGHETEWIEAGASRVVHYSKLPPGSYRFQVVAANEDGLWSARPAELPILVEPPFWRTWWFLGVVFASVIGIVAGIVHYISTQKLQRQLANLRQQEALEKERSRIARDIHDQLGANLTQVSLLGELIEGDREQPEEVAAHAKQIQATALETSRALDQIVWTVNPSNDTLDGLVNYICKYAQEYLALAGLKYRLDVPADLPGTPITPEIRHNLFLAAKEAINNVVKHAQASSAWLRLKIEGGRFTIEIEDDGKGPAGMNEKRAQSRNGLRNMGKRLEDVGGKFEIGPAPERGTLVRLIAPLGRN